MFFILPFGVFAFGTYCVFVDSLQVPIFEISLSLFWVFGRTIAMCLTTKNLFFTQVFGSVFIVVFVF